MTDALAGAEAERFILDAEDGHRVVVDCWRPTEREARGVVQILHGLSEHAGRYERFARQCCLRGLAVVAHNHRGHGEACAVHELGHFADDEGWNKVLGDVDKVRVAAADRFPDLPYIVFGHSMGSYIAQAYLMRNPDVADRLVLSGSTSAPRLQLYLGRFAAWLEARRHGPAYPSPNLHRQAFGAFNRKFVPVRTEFDWLSRDATEVDRYVHDILCGAVPSAKLWQDLLGGMLQIGRKKALRAVPAELPVLITGGGADPVGGARGMQRLFDAYRKTGHNNVRLEVFDDARHEMLNETNRDEFMRFCIDWMVGKDAKRRA